MTHQDRPLSQAQGVELERLTYAALDALRDADRAAVDLVTTEPTAPEWGQLRDQRSALVRRAHQAETELVTAIRAVSRV